MPYIQGLQYPSFPETPFLAYHLLSPLLAELVWILGYYSVLPIHAYLLWAMGSSQTGPGSTSRTIRPRHASIPTRSEFRGGLCVFSWPVGIIANIIGLVGVQAYSVQGSGSDALRLGANCRCYTKDRLRTGRYPSRSLPVWINPGAARHLGGLVPT
jgi:hypothetical protein